MQGIDLLAGLEELALPDVYLEQFQQTGDAEAFAEAHIGFFKAAFEPYLF
jgi:hypothetical protein